MTLNSYLKAFAARNPAPLAQTPRANLWRVDTEDGPAVLKVLTERGLKVGDMIGTDLLGLWGGEGAVRLIAQAKDALLMEWLQGPPLKDTTPYGRDELAVEVIAETALKLRRPATEGFIDLKDHFGGVHTKAEPSSFPEPYGNAFSRAKFLWHELLKTTQESCLMHGDLNYDNILWSERGWCAIDPKGIIGDPCYEFSVVFRNPIGEEERAAKPERMLTLAEGFATRAGLDKTRILQFGFAHVAMSLAYHFDRTGRLSETDLAIFLAFDRLGLAGSP